MVFYWTMKLSQLTEQDKNKLAAELDGFVKHPVYDFWYRNGDIEGKSIQDSIRGFDERPYSTSYDAIIPLIRKQSNFIQNLMGDYLYLFVDGP